MSVANPNELFSTNENIEKCLTRNALMHVIFLNSQCNESVSKIIACAPPKADSEDERIGWIGTHDGDFSVGATYKLPKGENDHMDKALELERATEGNGVFVDCYAQKDHKEKSRFFFLDEPECATKMCFMH
ncbi:hypothetical protein PIB30_078545 [Stylosanthes scabra]|uniref:Uncharacterized protein n=1 Tax=Stylosanthes scabra TaxID=79078 RepID=A0ABU6SR93_9FABA|nr:hypothetical protein [Stylosanthes scabra]